MANEINKDLKEIQRRKNKALKKNDYAEASRLCNTAGELLSANGDYEVAIDWHKEELNFSEEADDITGIAISHRKIGECCCELGQFSRALRHQKKQLSLAQSISNSLEEQRALATIGRTLFVQSDTYEREIERERCLLESQEAYLKSLALCDKLKNEVPDKEVLEMKARLCLNLGLVYEWRNNLNQAEKFMEKALISSRENNLKENMYRCYLSLSGVTAKSNKLQESLRYAKRAQHLAKEKGNKSTEADAVMQIAQVLLKLGEFSTSLQVFRQSHKLNPPELQSDEDTFLSLLRLAYRGEKYKNQLRSCGNDDDILVLYEKLGDIYGEAKSPLKALEFYEKQLSLAQKLNKTNISSIYISLAITHAENRNVEKALEYYNKELEIRTKAGLNKDYKETCATYSAIAKLQEDTGKDAATVKATYLKALQCAKKSGSISAEIRVSKELSETLQKFGFDEEYEDLKKRIEYLENEKIESDDDADSQNVKEEEEDVGFLLADSDSSDEETATKRKRYSKNKQDKPNDKGETPLHLACINGNTSKVKELLEKGASVSARDHCGWQPLHEACNFGHTEIIRLLLAYGANANDPGGDHCGNVTPLHDAAQNGHLGSVQMLIKHRADPYVQDSKGKTPLDLVEKAIKADEEELDDSESDVLSKRRDVRKYLKEIMAKRKQNFQLRNRNVLGEESDEDIADSNSDKGDARYVLSCKIAKARERSLGKDSIGASQRRDYNDYGDNKATSRRKTDDFSATGQRRPGNYNSTDRRNTGLVDTGSSSRRVPSSASVNHGSFVKSTGADIPNFDGDVEMIDTDEDSTYASMDEDGLGYQSPLKPLAPLSLSPMQQLPPLSHSPLNQVTSLPATELDRNNTALPMAGSSNQYKPTHYTVFKPRDNSDSESSQAISEASSEEPAALDEFLVKEHAQKRRRIDVAARRKVQSTIPVMDVSRSASSLTNANRRISSSTKRSRSKLKKQTRITTSYAAANTPDRGFRVNTALCPQRSNTTASSSSSATRDRAIDGRNCHSTSSSHASDASLQRHSASVTQSNLMRIRVRVDKELFLIPCADAIEKRTVNWLADQASQRYSSIVGMSAKVSLKTQEGATLCPTDFVSDVLMNNEQVQAVITGWNAGSLSEKYETECACQKIKTRDDIIEALSPGDLLSYAKLADFNLTPKDITAVCKAFTGHSRLSKIDLTGNYFGVQGMISLCSAIQYIPNLRSLVLVCTGLTTRGFASLSESLSLKYQLNNTEQEGGNSFHPLEELNCSCNSFEDSTTFLKSLRNIARKCPRLKALHLDHCCINAGFQGNLSTDEALKGFRSLQSLSLAGNSDISFVNGILPYLTSTIQDLDLSGDSLHSQTFTESLLVNLRNIFKSPQSCLSNLVLREMNLDNPSSFIAMLTETNLAKSLQKLDINGSNVKDHLVLRSIAAVQSLKELDLSRNEKLDSSDAEFLISCLASSKTSLSILKMTSCDIQSLSGEFTRELQRCRQLSYVDLSFNETCYQDKLDVADSWRDSHVGSESCIEGDFCILSREGYVGIM